MKFRNVLLIIVLAGLAACKSQETKLEQLTFDKEKALYLYSFAYQCIDQEYPNKTGHVLGSDSDLLPPREMHPAFYGCFDWHSAVHGHWTLVSILSEFPDFEHKEVILEKLKNNINPENIAREIAYFDDPNNKDFERTYGWAWLLKLDEALRNWDHPEATAMQQALDPLTMLLAEKFIGFLQKMNYPIRVGEHTNIAFAMSFALDWAEKYHPSLAESIKNKAVEFFGNDKNCPLTWEPGAFDFISPCLQEAALMLKVLPENKYRQWLNTFMPGFDREPGKHLYPVEVSDRADGKLAHLDGLNFSRAWCLFEIGHALNDLAMIQLATVHFNHSYHKMDSGEYAGSHWLASFATYALMSNKAKSGDSSP